MSRVTKRYENRQAEFTDRYTVQFETLPDGTISIFVPEHPANPFSKSEYDTHLNPATKKLCINNGRKPRSLEMAEAIVHYWMSRFSEYIRSGEFTDDGGRVDV